MCVNILGVLDSPCMQHGKNQFPDDVVPGMRPAMLQYIDQVTNLGNCLSDAVSLSLGLDANYMREKFLSPEPVAIVRCFKYHPPNNVQDGKPAWGIGEHTGTTLCGLNYDS